MNRNQTRTLPRMSCGVLGLLLVCATSAARAEWVEWVGDVAVSAEYRHNLNFSAFSETATDDWVANLDGSFGRFFQAADQTRLGFRAAASANVYEKYRDLHQVTAALGVVGIHKFGLGHAPVVRAHLTQEFIESQDRMRDGSRIEAGLQLSKRLTERFDGSIGITRSIREGHDGDSSTLALQTDVFDQSQTIWNLRGNYLVTERMLLSGQFARLDGDFDSQCPEGGTGPSGLGGPPGPGKEGEPAIKAAALDKVFGGACTYRLDGTVNIYSVDFSYFLTPTASVDVGYVFRDGKAGSLEYNSPSIRMGLSWIF